VKSIAEETWKKGFVHLTVDGFGLVSLWDEDTTSVGRTTEGTVVRLKDITSYLRLELTPEQVAKIEETMKKGGATP
jgi:hypothetical protein